MKHETAQELQSKDTHRNRWVELVMVIKLSGVPIAQWIRLGGKRLLALNCMEIVLVSYNFSD